MMYEKNENGSIEVICGSMFSGKSEELIRRIRRATYGKLAIRAFKPALDNRYDEIAIVSHNGTETVAVPVEDAMDIIIKLKAELEEIDVVAVDEVQFFGENMIAVAEYLADAGVRVILAGLDTDFRGEPFGPMAQLMPRAESITKLSAICPICANPATRTQRLINGKPAAYDDPIILVGAAESYEPRCRQHHEVPNRPNFIHLTSGLEK